MNVILRNVLAVIAGVASCMVVKIVVIKIGAALVPAPEGVDMNSLESIKAHTDLFHAKHYLFPFLEHALGSLVGGLLAALIAASRKLTFALVIGGIHLMGGIAAALLIPAPAWFIALDLGLAYLPMAWVGGKLALRIAR